MGWFHTEREAKTMVQGIASLLAGYDVERGG